MSRIDELIEELCPDGVPRHQLGELVRVKAGSAVSKQDIQKNPGAFPVINSGRDPLGFINSFNTEDDPIGVTSRGAGVGSITWCTGKYFRGNLNYGVSNKNDDKLDVRYLYHVLMHSQSRIHEFCSFQGIPALNKANLERLLIPVPPLEVQREIVRVLDQFTQLEAELEARRRQYNYFAGRLLTLERDVPHVKFGDVATIVRGASPRPIQQFLTDDPDGVPWIKIGDVPAGGKYIAQTEQRVTLDGGAKSRRVMPGDFVLSNSMSFGRPYIVKIEGYIHDGWLAVSDFNDSYMSDYLYYLLRSAPVQEEFKRRAGAGTVQNLNAEVVRSLSIPVPPREVQQRVVAILDKFDALVNDLSIGLPAELAARRKQYEYYRDKLLTFKEAV